MTNWQPRTKCPECGGWTHECSHGYPVYHIDLDDPRLKPARLVDLVVVYGSGDDRRLECHYAITLAEANKLIAQAEKSGASRCTMHAALDGIPSAD